MVNYYLHKTGITAFCWIEGLEFALKIVRISPEFVTGNFSERKETLGEWAFKKYGILTVKEPLALSELLFDENIKKLFKDYLSSHKICLEKDNYDKKGFQALKEIIKSMEEIISVD